MTAKWQSNAESDQIIYGVRKLCEKVLQKDGCDILLYGKSKAGKTTLANALMSGVSGGGKYTPGHGTLRVHESEISQTTYGRNIRIYDTQGLLAGEEKKVMAAIRKGCNIDEIDQVIVCQDWLGPYEERNLKILHRLDHEIWSRVTFVMTKCDIKPPEIQYSTPEERKSKIQNITTGWRTNITNTLRRLGYVGEIHITYTAHTLAEQSNNMDWTEFGEESSYTTVNGVYKCILDGVCSLINVVKNLRLAIALTKDGHLLFGIKPHEIEEKLANTSTQIKSGESEESEESDDDLNETCSSSSSDNPLLATLIKGAVGSINGSAILTGITTLLKATTTTTTTTTLSASSTISTTTAAIDTMGIGTTTGDIITSSTTNTAATFLKTETVATGGASSVAPIVVGAIVVMAIGAATGYGFYRSIKWFEEKNEKH